MIKTKFVNFIKKLSELNKKRMDALYKVHNVIWLLKLIYGYDTTKGKITTHALEWPVRGLLTFPLTVFSLFIFSMVIINYFSEFLENEYFSYIILGMFIVSIWSVFSPLIYFISPFNPVVQRFFKVNGSMNTVIEFRWVTKLLMVSIPIMIISASLFTLINETELGFSEKDLNFTKMILLFTTILTMSISIAIIAKFALLMAQQNFRLYLAKSSIELSMNVENEYDKIQYITFGINSYNKFLRKTIKLQFYGIGKIIEQIISESNKMMNENLKEIHDFMTPKNAELVRILTKKINPNENKILVNISLKDKVQEWSPIILIASSVSVSLIQYLPSISTMIQTIQDYLK